MTRVATLALAILTGCVAVTEPYVQSIAVQGREITVVRCPIEKSGGEIRALTDQCVTKTLQLPSPAAPATRGRP